MSATLRWSLLVGIEASLLLFLLVFGNALIGNIGLHRIQLVILAVLGGIGWLVVLARPSVLPPLLVIAPLPVFASLVITSVSSPYPSLSWYATWQSAAYVGIAWLLAIQASHPVGRRNLISVMGIVLLIVVVAYFGHVLSSWRDWLILGFPLTSVPLRPHYSGGLLLIPAWLADVVVLSTPVVTVSLWLGRHSIPAVVLAASGLVAIVLSGTRSVLLLVAAVSIVAVVFVILSRGSGRTKTLSGIGLATVAVVGIGVVLLAGRGFDLGRSSTWASAVDRFAEAPLMGTGPGTYGVNRMSDQTDTLFNLAQSDSLNVLLTTAADSGLVGLAGLALSVVAYGVASGQVWRRSAAGRPVLAAAGLAILVFTGHALGEYVFGLIGVIILLIANVSIAATDVWLPAQNGERRPRWLVAALLVGVLVIALSSVFVVRNEMTLTDVATADGSAGTPPALALEAARRATAKSPDSVPAWWVRMVAADAAGDAVDAITSARRTVDLEGFGQEWLSLAVLLARSGDSAGARNAMDHAVDFSILDPVVLLNAAIFFDGLGAKDEATNALTRLLQTRWDIEPLLMENVPALAPLAATARAKAATAILHEGDASSAFLVALSGDDRPLAEHLRRTVAAQDPVAGDAWQTIISAWFGDAAARVDHDLETLAHPGGVQLAWSWRLAVRACDQLAADRWERAIETAFNYHPSMPVALGVAPVFHFDMLPPRYPVLVWRMDLPQRAYVEGIWTYGLGRAPCEPRSGRSLGPS